MGRTAPVPEYRDEPEDAVSLHTTPDDYAYSDAASPTSPPSYADSEADAAAPRAPIYHTPPPTSRTDHSNPAFRNGKPTVCTTSTHMDPRYDTDPIYLESAVRSLAAAPPVPLIYIMGTHTETTRRGDKKETREVTDFRLVLSLAGYLHPNFAPGDTSPMQLTTAANKESTHRGTVFKARAPGARDLEDAGPAPSLTEWCHRFCASASPLRVFRLTRSVTGLDTPYLSSRIEGLLRATSYRGHIRISFPVEDAHADIYTSHRVNSWRTTPWICWAFYLSFLWLLTWPLLFFCTKRYAVIRAEWPFSATTAGRKVYTTVSEEQYVERWGTAIRRLALEGYQGAVGEDVMRGVSERDADPPVPRTGVNVNTGHAGVDSAVGFLSQGIQVARALSGGDVRGVSQGLQGGWGYDS
ncbi:hypothetical protein C7974DRAFT_365703 [Boeremia exigua]|uniref:uncharacterized protein n=1 Tax=Boeremia exigua TaxID=749465 RepID=UPI001E8E402C|nr:uncharacterized protein C7974DRAFT_365703 [Boeremia exigua]KAH6616404.1 hypothetical protein C7974DRAFT_365703 [Boeremia exigua]